MKIRNITENISSQQRSAGQLPADFRPADTSPQLNGPYPGRNATRGYLVGEDQDMAEGHADQQRKIFKRNGQPVGEVGIDRESSPGVGQYYMKHYASGTDNSGYDSYEDALGDLRHVMKQSIYGELREQGVAEGTDFFDKFGLPIMPDDDGKFRDMMRGIKKGTKKQAAADRRERDAASRERARAAFGPSPADKLSIRPDKGVAEAANTGPYIVYATGPRTQGINDVDLVFKDIRKGKIVARVVGNNRHLQEFAPPSGGDGGDGGDGRDLADRPPTYEIRMGDMNRITYVAFGDPQQDSEHKVYKLGPAKPGAPKYYGQGLTLVSELDWWSFLEKMIGEIMWEDDAIEAGYVDRLDNGDLVFARQQGVAEGGDNPLADERREQSRMDAERREFKRDELAAELGGEEQRAQQIMSGTWYIVIDGQVWQRGGQPVTFPGRDAARRAGQTIKNRTPERTVTITTKLPTQRIAELTDMGTAVTAQPTVTPTANNDQQVEVIFFGVPGKDYWARDAWDALEEVLPNEYPRGSERAQLKIAEVQKHGGAVVTVKPLAQAKKLVDTFRGYGIKARINASGINESVIEQERLRIFRESMAAGMTSEDVITTMKRQLGDYLQDVAKAIKKDPDLVNKIPKTGDQIGPAVRTIKTDDGHEIRIHGNEDDGFRVSIRNRTIPSRFKSLDEAEIATEMYCARRRQSTQLRDDYVDEA